MKQKLYILDNSNIWVILRSKTWLKYKKAWFFKTEAANIFGTLQTSVKFF